MANTFTIASKEFSDIVKGRRFILLVAVFALVMGAAVATVYLSNAQNTAAQAGMPRSFLSRVANSLGTMMSYFAPILGLALGVDAISGEKEKGTLKLTLAQPVFRDTIINGKFLSAFLAISLATLIATISNIAVSVIALGITPTGDDVARLTLFMLFSIIFAMTFYGIAIFLSTVSKRTTTSVIVGVVIWIISAFIISIIASLVATSMVPISFQPGQNITRTGNSELIALYTKRTAIEETINSFTPNYHFSKIAQYILEYSVNIGRTGGGIGGPGGVPPGGFAGGNSTRTTTTTTTSSSSSSVRSVSVTESLSSAWPNILVLVLVMIIAFIASYMLFTRQEIR